MSTTTQRIADNLDFIKQTIDPRSFVTRPPPLQHPSALFKKVDINANLLVTTVTDTRDAVPNDNGLILWFPTHGVGNIYHHGIIPKGGYFPLRGGGATLPLGFTSPSQSTIFGDAVAQPGIFIRGSFGINHFVFAKALNIPRLDSEYNLTIAPELSRDFSSSRQYGGLLEVYSSTIPSSGVSLNGTISTAVVSDTRDIAQNESGTDCYDVVDLAQAARTAKEVVKQVSIANGVINVQGPDIPPDYRPPNFNDVDVINGGWQSVLSNFNINTLETGFNLNFVTSLPIFAAWMSPWGVEQYEVDGGSGYPNPAMLFGINGNPLPIDAIGEESLLDIKLSYNLFTSNMAGSTIVDSNLLVSTAVDFYFARVTDSASGAYTLEKISMLRTDAARVTAAAQNPTNGSQYGPSASPGIVISWEASAANVYYDQGGFARFGKFIGARVAASFMAQGGSAGDIADFHSNRLVIEARARDLYVPGRTGPCHIIRYDQVGDGQNIRVTGLLNTENVAKADLAPYVQAGIMHSSYNSDVGIYALLYALYNGPGIFKSSWSRADWVTFVKDHIAEMDVDDLIRMAKKDARVQSSAEAAGFFSDLGTVLGGGLGSLIGAPELGAALGNLGGGLVDSVTGASGQFGASAAPQFGTNGAYAGGQFGSHSGANAAGRRHRNDSFY